jgi:HAD superfamily hydrolase (TIGR01509 family)
MYNKFMLVIFDLDGVLVEAKEIHFQSLNKALSDISEDYVISWEEHLKSYDGLKTLDKLLLLSKNKNLPHDEKLYQRIFNDKQYYTSEFLGKIPRNFELIELFTKLKSQGFKLACCSNSIRQTVDICLKNLGIIDFFDITLSNENVKFSKPHPEIYWKAMSHFGIFPCETIIVEDSPVGLKSAYSSGAYVIRVNNPKDLKFELIQNSLRSLSSEKIKWKDKKMNVVIPMAGNGSRFQQAGYTFPKPLIEVNGKPMIQVVIENLAVDANFIFIVQKEHRQKYNLDSMLPLISPG